MPFEHDDGVANDYAALDAGVFQSRALGSSIIELRADEADSTEF